MRTALAAAGLLLVFHTAAAASPRDDRYFVAWGASSLDVTRAMRCPAPIACRKVHKHRRKHNVAHRRSLVRGFAREVRKALPGSNRLTGVVPTLAAKARDIVSACGSRVISGVRHTYIAGTRHISLHASGKAVDIAGNPGCIYAHLRGWPGGYSVDYARVRHVHVSYDPGGRREWGLRFAHYRGHGRRVMSARRHHRRRG